MSGLAWPIRLEGVLNCSRDGTLPWVVGEQISGWNRWDVSRARENPIHPITQADVRPAHNGNRHSRLPALDGHVTVRTNFLSEDSRLPVQHYPPGFTDRSTPWHHALFVVLLGTLAALTWMGGLLLSGQSLLDTPQSTDLEKYRTAANHILEHGTYLPTTDRLPVYPLIIAATFLLFGSNNLMAVLLVNCLFTGGTVLAVAMSAAMIRQSWLFPTTILAMFWPNLIYPATLVLPDTVFAFFSAWGFFFLLKNIKQNQNNIKYSLVSGLFFGIAYMTKGAILIWPVILFVFLYFHNRFAMKRRRRYAALMAILPVTVMMICTIPQFLRNYQNFGILTYTTHAYSHTPFLAACLTEPWGCGTADEKNMVAIRTEAERRISTMPRSAQENYAIRLMVVREVVIDFILEIPVPQLIKAVIGGEIRFLFHSISSMILERFQIQRWHPSLEIFHGSKQLTAFSTVGTLIWLISILFVFLTRMIQLVGIVSGLKQSSLRWQTIAILLFVFTVSVSVVSIGNPRYRAPLEPVFILLTMMGTNHIQKFWHRNKSSSLSRTR
ncbi:MAG: glycosyltransferase family 39 protein [Magnetococcus sp. DMHC-1]